MATEWQQPASGGVWLSWTDKEWAGRKPVLARAGRPMPEVPQDLRNANMKKPIDQKASQKMEADFEVLIDGCDQADEYATQCRILDSMDAGRISPPQANKLLKRLFRKFDGGHGMCRIDRDGNVISMEATDGQ